MKLSKKEKAIFAKGCAVGAAKQKASTRRYNRRRKRY